MGKDFDSKSKVLMLHLRTNLAGTLNSRNGHSSKTIKGDFGEVEITTPRDRKSTFEPQIIRKGQTRITEFDQQILTLYAKGMTTRDIAETFREMYGAEVSHSLISKVTEAVIEEVVRYKPGYMLLPPISQKTPMLF